jgi:transcriptional regulator of nitric oxide reductase
MTTEQQMATNVRKAITTMKRHGTTGASYECLRQNTSTTGLVCSVPEYHRAFREAAETLAKKMRFSVYE